MKEKTALGRFTPLFICIAIVGIGAVVVVASNRSAFFHIGASAAPTEKLDSDIKTAEALVATNPPLTKPYLNLASLYLQKVRETSDSSYYAKIDELMDKAAAIDPTDGDVPAIRASVAMGRHDFQTGKTDIQKALALNDHTAAYYGLNGDADIELGQYQDAVDSFQKMVDIRPDFSSWSRIAYIRELYGDIPGAKEALTQAISSGSNYPENIAWAYVEMGKLQMRDDLPAAKVSFNSALQVLPTYTQAMEGLGKVAFFEGDTAEAERQFTAAYNGLALAQYAVDLGDLYAQEKDTTKAAQQYTLAQIAYDTSTKGGVNIDLEESLFLSDHDLNLPDALAMATRAHQVRPSEYAADYLSWALYKNGKVAEATTYTAEAFKIGEIDPLILYHQGIIALANNDKVHAKEYLAKAYALNPNVTIKDAAPLKAALDSVK